MNINFFVEDNFATYKGTDNFILFVESFDNREFEVRCGNYESSELIGVVTATTNAMLNDEVSKLISQNNKIKGPEDECFSTGNHCT